MKVLWLVPPPHKGKYPNIGQYRFYKNTPVKSSLEYPYLNAMGVTQLYNADFSVTYLDCPAKNISSWERIWTQVRSADLVIMEARTPIVKYIYQCCHKLGFNGHTKTALFGDHVTWNPQEALNHCDYVISGGDYDYAALKLAEELREGKKPERIFRAGLVGNLDSLPHVNREIVPWNDYFEAWRIRDVYLYTMSGRGCWYRCRFCAWIKEYWECRVRQRSVEDVAAEFAEALSKYDEPYIWDDHDCFDTAWGYKFAQRLLDYYHFSHKEILWGFQTHSNLIPGVESLKVMKRAGLHLVKLGIESGNQGTLDLINKGLTVEQHERAIDRLKEADITVHANLMVGFPWETKQEAYHTIEWIKKLDPNQAQFSLVIPYPWTELYTMAKDNGWLLVQEGDWESFDATHPMLSMPGMTTDEITKLYRDCWDHFYLNWHYKLRHLRTVHTLADLKQLIRGYYSVRFGHMRAMED
jgi:anaerobic magnesium-protoporphyrin IX monomethyl ester cyclase